MLKLGSLFDGSGTCPLAAALCGIRPVWASEIEKFPIQVTSARFPDMKHLGDITKINGAEIEPVDVITFGSPCQDLSVAGRRAGLEGEKSSLFTEAIRIIREMREATNGEYPRFIMWENVPGAFSSNKGADFRTVLEEITQAEIPMPDGGKWATAGMVELPECQIAWRVLDAQYWGVPQRRKRIFLVADFRGERAGEVLFKPESLFRDFTQSGEAREGIADGTESGLRNTGALPINLQIATRYNALGEGTGPGIGKDGDPAFTLQAAHSHGVCAWPNITSPLLARADSSPCIDRGQPFVVAGFMAGQGAKAGGIGYKEEISPTLKTPNSGGNTVPSVITYPAVTGTLCASGAGLNRPAGQGNEADLCVVAGLDVRNSKENGDLCGTLQAKENGGYSLNYTHPVRVGKTVRRLTPTECARLQGFPDWWTADIPHSDSAEYKMWGNGMALPCVLYIMQNIKTALT